MPKEEIINGIIIGYFIGPNKGARKQHVPANYFPGEKKVRVGIGNWEESASSREEAIQAAEKRAKKEKLEFKH